MLIRVLVHLAPAALRRRVEVQLGLPDVLVVEGVRAGDLWQRLSAESCDLLLANQEAVEEPLLDLIRSVRSMPEDIEVIIFSAVEDAAERARFQAAGSFAVVHQELTEESLRQTLATLVQRRREQALSRLAPTPGSFQLADFVTASPAMRQLMEVARKVASADSSLLLLGETGVGKEWLGRALHAEGPRRNAPFIAVNCAAMPETLLESELFGHERGAFTGAIRARRGHFEMAHRGTLFLDEIGDMSPHLQVRLLRVLQERRIQRLGSEQPIEVDVRLMAATNRDLEEAMAAKEFRLDLYYRLAVITLTLPPLRERREDIAQLADTYLRRFRAQLGLHRLQISDPAMAALLAYDWPGNVRELINVLERAVLLSDGSRITLGELPEVIASSLASDTRGAAVGDWDGLLEVPLSDALERLGKSFERFYLQEHLRRAAGRVGQVAQCAGIDPRTLYNKLKRHDLRKEDYRRAD